MLPLDLLYRLFIYLYQGVLPFIGLIAITIIIIFIFYPEKIEKWIILFHKLLAYISEKHERKYISKYIESGINRHVEKFNNESEGIFPYGIKVEWVDVNSLESCLKDGVLLIKMKNHRNQSKNFALAVSEYVPKALIPIARVYVHPPLMKAIDYVISKEILTSDTVAFNYFIDIRKREMESAENLIEEVEEIHRKGYLGRILLFEYKKLDLLYPADPKPDVHEETKNFELKVYRLATKKPEEKVDAICLGKYIKAVVVPIARVETLEYFGIEAHLKFIGESLEKGINTFYVVAAGEGNIYLARQVVGEAEKRYKLRKIREDEYHGIHRGKRMKMFVGTLVRNESTT